MHKQKIIHRDLKPENILFLNLEGEFVLKIIDFGTAKKVRNTEKLKVVMGTPYYIAPEVIKGNYDLKCDIWTIGVILYVLLSGCPPFNGDTDEEIMLEILKGNYSFNISPLKGISCDAKDLISMMLRNKPNERPSAIELLQHNWFKDL